MAPNLTLADAYTVEFAATDPTTGADVTGVDVSNVSILIGETGTLALSAAILNPVLLRAGS